jgi:hypothetical protein
VLDIGCFDDILFRQLADRITSGANIDPLVESHLMAETYELYPGHFPGDLPSDIGLFDAIAALAIFEHVPPDRRPIFAQKC